MKMKELAALCRKWRIENGITQRDISEKAGVSPQAVNMFENGKCNSLKVYCAYLDYGFKSDFEKGGAILRGCE